MNLNDALKDIPPKTKISIQDLDAGRELYSGLRGRFNLKKYAGIRLDSEVVSQDTRARKPVDGKSGYMIVLNIRRPRR